MSEKAETMHIFKGVYAVQTDRSFNYQRVWGHQSPDIKPASSLTGLFKLCSFVNHAIYGQTCTDDRYGPGHRRSSGAEASSQYPVYQHSQFNNTFEHFRWQALDALYSSPTHRLGKAQQYQRFRCHTIYPLGSSIEYLQRAVPQFPTKPYIAGPRAARYTHRR